MATTDESKNPTDDEQTPARSDEAKTPEGESSGGEGKQTDWQAHAKTWETRAKANLAELNELKVELGETRTELDQLKQVQQGDAEKAELETLRAENHALLKEAVAASKGVPAHRITGATREELEADADKFLEEVGPQLRRGFVPTSGQGGEAGVSNVATGRERAREQLNKTS